MKFKHQIIALEIAVEKSHIRSRVRNYNIWTVQRFCTSPLWCLDWYKCWVLFILYVFDLDPILKREKIILSCIYTTMWSMGFRNKIWGRGDFLCLFRLIGVFIVYWPINSFRFLSTCQLDEQLLLIWAIWPMDLLFSNRQLDLPDCKSFSRLIKICSHEFKKHYWITIRENELATYMYLEKTTMYSYSKRTNCWICDIGFLWPFEKKSLCL